MANALLKKFEKIYKEHYWNKDVNNILNNDTRANQ